LPGVLDTLAAAPQVPVFALTPFLPNSYARVRARLGDRCIAGLPALAAEPYAGAVRYFCPPLSRTLFEADSRYPELAAKLVQRLGEGGVPAATAGHVLARNAATTIAFFPITVALSMAGSLARLARDRELVVTMLAALDDARRLARDVGPIDPAVALLLHGLGPRALGAAAALGRHVVPGALTFLEDHFAHKLHAQHLALGDDVLELASERGRDAAAIAELMRSYRRLMLASA
jgi:hypothetical protein